MTFGRAIAVGLGGYARFEGRARASEFWWFILFVTLVSAALGTLDQLVVADGLRLGSTLVSLWSVAVLLPTLAVAVRRLRDGGNSWAQLFWVLVPIAGLIVLAIRFCDPPYDAPAHDAPPSGDLPPGAPRI